MSKLSSRKDTDISAGIAARTLKTVFDVVLAWEQEFAGKQEVCLVSGTEWDKGYAEAVDEMTTELRELFLGKGIEVPNG